MTTVVPAPAGPLPAALPAAPTVDPDDGTLRIEVDGGTLRVSGEIDLCTADDLRAALRGLLGRRDRAVVVDLRGVSFVDCAGVGLLVDARRRAARSGTALRIVAGRAVARTAALLDLTAALGL